MAMTKKEKAEFDAVVAKLELTAALRWTEEVKRDLSPPTGGFGNYTYGWDINSYSAFSSYGTGTIELVYPAWSGSVSHGTGEPERAGKNASQCSRTLYSTKLVALKALRFEVELKTAGALRKIDKAIAEELAKPSGAKHYRHEQN